MRVFIYSRKSVASSRGESIENQIEMCKNYIISRFCNSENTNFKVYEDEGFSAKSTSRPQFLKMLSDMKTEKPDCIVSYRLDRISRNVGDFSAFIEQLNSLNISFICINEDFDTSKPIGKAMMYITSVFAELERETIAERVKDNMFLLAKTGRWLGGTAPFGFESKAFFEMKDSREKCAYYLCNNESETAVVRLIYQNFLKLKKYNAVSELLLKRGIKNRNSNSFSASAVRQILKNPVYCAAQIEALDYFKKLGSDICFEKTECDGNVGLAVYNKRNYSKRNFKILQENDWIVTKGRHKAVIPAKDWIKVQKIIKNNTKNTGLNDYSLLKGVLYCKKCGSPMTAKQRSNSGEKLLFDYICSKKSKKGKNHCDSENLAGLKTDCEFFDILLSYITSDSEYTERLKIRFSPLQKRKIVELAVLKAVWDGEKIEVFLK